MDGYSGRGSAMESTMRSFLLASSLRSVSDLIASLDLIPHSTEVASAAELGISPFHPDMNGTDGEASPEFVDF